MDISQHVRERNPLSANTPQTEPMSKDQVQNAAGGYGWQLDKWGHLGRFLVLGSEGGTYYASEKDLTKANYENVLKCIAEDGMRVVNEAVAVSKGGRAPKNDPAIFVIALAAAKGDPKTRGWALANMPEVCRIGTHIFQFVQFHGAFRGWSRSLRDAVTRWYNIKDTSQLAYQVAKYQNRNGWTHRDILRLCHAHPKDTDHQLIFKWIVKGELEATLPFISGMIKAREPGADVAALVREHKLTREMVPTEALNDIKVWDALLADMPVTAMFRNLGKMTNVGLIAPFSDAAKYVAERLTMQDNLRKGKVHPLNLAVAMKTYGSGHGVKGSLSWSPVAQVMDALDTAIELSFGVVEPTGKNIVLGLDVSGSMRSGFIAGTPLTPREAVGILALTVAKVEPHYTMVGFCNRLVDIPITAKDTYQSAMDKCYRSDFGGTDCSLPMIAAMQGNWPVDTFHTYTDNETWAGHGHPRQVLAQYRQKSGRAAKSVVIGMTATDFTIADPNDPGMLDVVGLDLATPQLIADFSK